MFKVPADIGRCSSTCPTPPCHPHTAPLTSLPHSLVRSVLCASSLSPLHSLLQAQAAKDRAFTDNDAPLKETPFHAVLVAVRGIDEPQTPEEWLTLPAVLLDWEQVRAAFEMKKCTHLLDAAVLNHSVTICVEVGGLQGLWVTGTHNSCRDRAINTGGIWLLSGV